MARIRSSFVCMICSQPLNFPNNIGVVEFLILILQFYNAHELCEKTLSAQQLKKFEQKLEKPKPVKRKES